MVPAIRRERCFLFHRIKLFRAAPQPRENLLMKKEVLTMSLQIEALSPIMWTIIIAVALVLLHLDREKFMQILKDCIRTLP